MKIERKLVKEQTLEKFAEENNLVLQIFERSSDMRQYTGARYYCKFDGIEVKDGHLLISITGNGNTEKDAIKDYTKRISEKTLVKDARSKTENRLIFAPRFI